MLTLLDLVTLQRNDILTGLVEDVTTYAPEFSRIPVVTRPGTWYEIVRRTALGTAAFRIVNNGTTPVKTSRRADVLRHEQRHQRICGCSRSVGRSHFRDVNFSQRRSCHFNQRISPLA
jgi:hypothetical protein